MLHRGTKIWLAIYGIYTLVFLTFIRAPGPPLTPAATPRAIPHPEGAELFELVVLPGGQRALAAVYTPEGSELWLLDWPRFDAWLSGDAELADLALARTPATHVPQYVSQLGSPAGGDELGLLIGNPEEGMEWLRWAPPADPERTELPPDTAWVTDAGEVITTAQLAAEVTAHDPYLRPWPGLALVTEDLACTRVNASPGPEHDDWISPDDLLLFDRDTGELRVHVDTYNLAGVATASRFGGIVYTTNEATWLEAWLCDEHGCGEARSSPYIGPKLSGITDLDVAPRMSRAALCAGERWLLLYAWDPERLDGAVLLGMQELADPCVKPAILDTSRVLVRQSGGWALVEFEPRGGWL
jgi:hypothetical protein